MKTSFFASALLLATLAVGCAQDPGDADGSHGQNPPPGNTSSSGGATNASTDGTITWCSTALTRTGTVEGTNLDYPSTPDTTWFNTSLEELALSTIDEEIMKNAGLSPDDKDDVARFKYFAHGFDFRLIVGDKPSAGNWFGKSDLSVYLFDVADNSTAANVAIEVFDASAVREARLSGDKKQLASTLRTTVDAMRAKPGPKAIVAFAPNRNPETSVERAFINLFARNIYFATTGSVTLSNLRDGAGAPIATPAYPLHNLRSVDASAKGDIAGTPFTANAGCLDVQTSG